MNSAADITTDRYPKSLPTIVGFDEPLVKFNDTAKVYEFYRHVPSSLQLVMLREATKCFDGPRLRMFYD